MNIGFGKKKDDGEEGDEEKKDEAGDAAEEGADGGGDEEAGGVGAMRQGDYMVHVFLEKIKEINIPEGATSVDPMVVVESLGQKQYSTAKDDIGGVGEVTYNEHIFLEAKNVEKERAESGKVMLKLMDKGMFKDCLIGEFELDLSFIYLKKDHVMLHQWLALSNPHGDNWADISCYMKVSVSVSCTGDEQVEIKEEEEEPEGVKVMMSPALNPSFYQIKIRIFAGDQLPMMDADMGFLGKAKIDAYMKTEFKKKKFKTKTVSFSKGDEPVRWNTEFWLPAQIPVIQQKIHIYLMDAEDLGYDEVAGSLYLNTKEILERHENDDDKFVWKNIYGSPLGQSNSKYKKKMNDDPEFASQWKGRVLLHISAEPTDKPVSKQVDITDEEILKKAEIALQKRKYAVKCQIGQCVALPSTKQYTVKVTVGGHQIDFNPISVKRDSNYKRYEEMQQQNFETSYVDCQDMGFVTFQLMDGKNPVCYHMEHISNFCVPGETTEERKEWLKTTHIQNKWVQWLPDQCTGKVRFCHKAGMFSFKMTVWDVTRDGDIEFTSAKVCPSWSKKFQKRATPVKIRAYIYLCVDLPSADGDGSSDPFIEVWDTVDEVKKTKVVEDNNNPLFYDVLELDYEVAQIDDLESYPPFIFDCYDHDDELFDSTPDFLGRAIIEPEDCAIKMYNGKIKHLQKEYDALPPEKKLRLQFEKCYKHGVANCDRCTEEMLDVPEVPRWHHFHFAPGEPVCGSILVSFSVAEHDFVYGQPTADLPLYKLVETKEMECNLLILGLRSLQSPGILPVKKAFINFNIKSLVAADGPALNNIQTEPKCPGPNPTLNTTMKFSIPLPTNELYCPKLGCQVYDCIFKGWNQPLIGTFVLPIGELMRELRKERQEETQVIRDINEKLDAILNQDPNLIVKSYNATNINATLVEEDEYSDNEDIQKQQKTTKKQRKKGTKAFNDKETKKDITENLGANEDEGNRVALETQREQLERASSIINSSQNAEFISIQKSKAESKSGMSRPSDPFKSGIDKKSAMEEYKRAQTLKKRIEQDEKQRDMEALNAKGDDAAQTVIMPKYKLCDRLNIDKEIDPPPKSMFIGLGWDEDATTNRRHYRQFYDDELENVEEIFPQKSPFNQFDLHHGVAKGNNDVPQLFSNLKTNKHSEINQQSKANTQQVVGYFKGVVEIEAKEDKEEYAKLKKQLVDDLKAKINKISMQQRSKPLPIDTSVLGNPQERQKLKLEFRHIHVDHLRITRHLCNLESDEIIKRNLLSEKRCMIKVYMISAFNLSSRDNGSDSDPYLILECNGKTFNERDNYQLDNSCPEFMKSYQFEGVFPGTTPLKISVMDYDMVFGDDLIGVTSVDLEDRYFSIEWNGLKDKPIEYREIYHESTSISQGTLKMWVEINPMQSLTVKDWDISTKPPVDLELRVCVLNCKEIPMMDVEGTVDAFCKGFFDTKEEVQETDTHFRCQDGKPDFEYRLVYHIQYPRKNYKYTLQIFDKDLFTSNELIGQYEIDLHQFIEDCSLVRQPLVLNKKYYDDVLVKKDPQLKLTFDKEDTRKVWLPMQSKKDGKIITRGYVRVQIDLLPKVHAEKNPVGKARDNPNHSPHLPNPEGRLELSLNPLKMFNQLVGPAMRRKIMMAIITFLCCALFVAILPNLVGNLITKMIFG